MKDDEIYHFFIPVHRLDGERIHAFLKKKEVLHRDIAPVDLKNENIAFPVLSIELFEQVKNDLASESRIPLELISLIPHYMEPNEPHRRLVMMVTKWWKGIPKEEMQGPLDSFLKLLPNKWERLGSLILFPNKSFGEDIWSNLSDELRNNLWQTIASALNATSIGIQSPIADDAVRSSQVVMLHGDSQVSFLDHGIHYEFDAAKVMFSSGNVTERRRIGSMNMKGETVVDAYAGVGYYSFPMIINAGAAHVHACEMNPPSIEGLLRGAKANEIEDKLTVHQGDNQETLPLLKGIAERCHLGLLPSSEAVWSPCLEALKPEGGWLHIHMNVEEEHIEDWKVATIARLQSLSDGLSLGFSVQGMHLERVKWYAPYVRHVVYDIECRPKKSGPSG
ncbi:MAG TPA: hypothetical protein QGI72_00700 [Poseidonia sp.]|nr:hypothetical protein [Poseidonia sp.]